MHRGLAIDQAFEKTIENSRLLSSISSMPHDRPSKDLLSKSTKLMIQMSRRTKGEGIQLRLLGGNIPINLA
jgi:hypothetical protein